MEPFLTAKHFRIVPITFPVLKLAVKNYYKIGGNQRAAAFAYYAFFSFFPLLGLMVASASFFVQPDHATHVVLGFIRHYVPLNDKITQDVSDILNGMINARGKVLVITPLVFMLAAFHFFNVLIRAVNEAWGVQATSWWHLPAKSLLLLGITGVTILLGIALPILGRLLKHWLFSNYDFGPWVYYSAIYFVPVVILFWGLNALYRFAPLRPTRFSQIWAATAIVTGSLFALEGLFVLCVKAFTNSNMIYGAFGGMVALLTAIYIAGCVTIFGACLSAAQSAKARR
jgi:YihY family inner membrane protein